MNGAKTELPHLSHLARRCLAHTNLELNEKTSKCIPTARGRYKGTDAFIGADEWMDGWRGVEEGVSNQNTGNMGPLLLHFPSGRLAVGSEFLSPE